jgi:hypothetical protein
MPLMPSPYARLCGLQGDLTIAFVESTLLRDNPLGDSAERPLVVYTPPGYDPEGSRRYPALYCLHGYTGNVAGLIAARPWERNVVQRADRLIAGGIVAPFLLVLVDGFTRLGGSQYVDSIHNGPWARHVVDEIVPFVDARFRTIPRDGARAVFGKSSGGFGALHLAMEHPGVFAAAASHSGDSYFRYAHPPHFPVTQRVLERHGGEIEAFVRAFEEKHKRSGDEYAAMEMLAYAAAYSPREARPFAIDLPFDVRTGELREDVFARWLAFDPVERAPQRRAALERLRLLYLDCGRRDEYLLDIGARALARIVREIGLAVRHEEFDDDHRNIGYRYDVSIPALMEVLDRS